MRSIYTRTVTKRFPLGATTCGTSYHPILRIREYLMNSYTRFGRAAFCNRGPIHNGIGLYSWAGGKVVIYLQNHVKWVSDTEESDAEE
jgi:hypothetical protein